MPESLGSIVPYRVCVNSSQDESHQARIAFTAVLTKVGLFRRVGFLAIKTPLFFSLSVDHFESVSDLSEPFDLIGKGKRVENYNNGNCKDSLHKILFSYNMNIGL